MKKYLFSKVNISEIAVFSLEVVFLILFVALFLSPTGTSFDKWPSLMNNVNGAILTILIPLAIAILIDYFRDKRNKNKNIDLLELDLAVIIQIIFPVIKILLILGLVFLPSFLWNIGSNLSDSFLLAIWLIGIFLLIKVIINFVLWIRGSQNEFRFLFLRKFGGNGNNIASLWESVWNTEKIVSTDEYKFFEILCNNINKEIRKRNFENSITLLETFKNYMEKRSEYFWLYTGPIKPFQRILSWNFRFSEKYKNDEEADLYATQMYVIIGNIIETTQPLMLRRFYYGYFIEIKKFLDSKMRQGEYKYVEDFLRNFYSILFRNLYKINNADQIWEQFPNEWKIISRCLENSEDRKNWIPQIIALQEFLRLAQSKIDQGENEIDIRLDDIALNLFPNTEPMAWADFVIFMVSSWSGTSRMEYLVLHSKRKFGIVGRVVGGFSSDQSTLEKDLELQYKAGLEENEKIIAYLAKYQRGIFMPKEEFINYTNQLTELEKRFKNDSSVLAKVKSYQKIMETILANLS
jgi:hypothetical protein